MPTENFENAILEIQNTLLPLFNIPEVKIGIVVDNLHLESSDP